MKVLHSIIEKGERREEEGGGRREGRGERGEEDEYSPTNVNCQNKCQLSVNLKGIKALQGRPITGGLISVCMCVGGGGVLSSILQ